MEICTKSEMVNIPPVNIGLYLEGQIQVATIDQGCGLILKSFCLVMLVAEETAPWGSHGHLKDHHPPRVEMGEIYPMTASATGHCSLSLVSSLVYFAFADGP